ncbi:uncharacterized protein [Littorina saxatilis]|uniref:uncharacterized protein n=1 Tax=Littorina saxatilis TaxID=31220 RepID=UPI0038B46582
MGIPLSRCSKPAKVKPAATEPEQSSIGLSLQPPADQQEYARSRPSLTERQEELLLESWKILREDMQRTGAMSFLGLFEAHPEQFQLFNKFRKMDPQSIGHTTAFHEHVLIVMRTIHKVFTWLREQDKVVLLLHDIGDIHREVGVSRRDFLLFIPFFLNSIKPALQPWTLELEQAWTTYMRLLSHVICERMHP